MRAAVLLCFVAGAALAQAPHDHQHSFKDAEQWAHVFDDPSRDGWQKPHQVIQALELAPDAVVADIGAGTGYFSARLSRMLPKGKVYAVDVEPGMVRHLVSRAKREKLLNVTAVQATPDEARLPEKIDLALFVDVYHHIDDRRRYFEDLRRALKPGGRVAIIDFTMDSDLGPPPRARVPRAQVARELAAAGYVLADEPDFLPNQYFLIFTASVQSK
ncbi:MAG TPA: class I SAM-dependent methyltransferase [Burkholderiales bacterium]